jgi:hypothetical protein
VSRTQLVMRAEAHQLKAVLVGLAVDEDEIGPDVAIAEILHRDRGASGLSRKLPAPGRPPRLPAE